MFVYGLPQTCRNDTWGMIACGSYSYSTLFDPVDHYCGITTSGTLLCWGDNTHHQARVPPVSSGVTWTSLAGSLSHVCGLTSLGELLCWGKNNAGQTSIPTLPDGVVWGRQVANRQSSNISSPPLPITLSSGTKVSSQEVPLRANYILTDQFSTCAITNVGGIVCWGGEIRQPPLVPSDQSWISISNGRSYSTACGITSTRRLVCWGDPSSNGTIVGPAMANERFSVIAIGSHHMCAVSASGKMDCCCNDAVGQIDVPIFCNGTTWRDVTVTNGENFEYVFGRTCGLSSSFDVHCWGSANAPVRTPPHLAFPSYALPAGEHLISIDGGGLGLTNRGNLVSYAASEHKAYPSSNNGSPENYTWSAITSGTLNFDASSFLEVYPPLRLYCGIMTNGSLVCWGDNRFGQSNVPKLLRKEKWVSVSTSGNHTCALTNKRRLLCWGGNYYNQLNVPKLPKGQKWGPSSI